MCMFKNKEFRNFALVLVLVFAFQLSKLITLLPGQLLLLSKTTNLERRSVRQEGNLAIKTLPFLIV